VQAAAPKKHEPISRPKRAPPADEARPPSRSELLARVDRRLARYQQLQSEGIDYVRVGETILRGQVRLEIERASDARSLLAAAKQLEEWESIYGSSL
jgi:hypothetical protein